MKTNWKILQSNTSGLSKLGVSEFVKRILVNRGINDLTLAEKFLNPKVSDIHYPYLVYEMDVAVKRILKAVKNKEKVFVYGDYDVDGVTATSILWEYLFYELGVDVLPYIPHRVDEGYGLNENAIEKLVAQGAKLIITVDCGIRDKELVARYKDSVDFIITDHHEIPEQLPDTIVLHARHPEGKYPFGEISGGAMAWKFVTAIKQKLGTVSSGQISAGIDLVALSTVCDVMPLIDENRVFVKYGLEKIKEGKRTGLLQLMNDAGIKLDDIDAYHLGFVLGPRINAAGRLEHALDAVRLLVTKDQTKAPSFSKKLSRLNLERQDITSRILVEAERQVASGGFEKKLLFVYGEEWPEGVVGLVAGRLTEKYHKPAIVASVNGSAAIGSARSIPAFNIIEAIDKFGERLIRYGGHAQAAGFTVGKEDIDDFRDSLEVLAEEIIKEEDLVGEIEIDARISLPELTMELIGEIEKLAPFGYGNRNPVFCSEKVTVKNIRTIGKENSHLKLIVSQNGEERDCIGFRMGELCQELTAGQEIDIVYNVGINEWNGRRSVQLKLKEVDY